MFVLDDDINDDDYADDDSLDDEELPLPPRTRARTSRPYVVVRPSPALQALLQALPVGQAPSRDSRGRVPRHVEALWSARSGLERRLRLSRRPRSRQSSHLQGDRSWGRGAGRSLPGQQDCLHPRRHRPRRAIRRDGEARGRRRHQAAAALGHDRVGKALVEGA